jgi:4-methylaminobutanoate oxidase (formaldehyde-forming)
VHHLLEQANASFGSRMGWERANFFAPAGESPEIDYAWGKQNWLPWSAREQVSTRTGVTVFDQTSFSKYVVAGPEAMTGLQWVCTADVDVPIGRAVYTGLLNARGTYESDLTVTRTGEQEFLLVSSAATTVRDQHHLRRHLPAGTTVTDVTTTASVFGVMGPRSRDLLGRLTDADLSAEAFRFGDSRLLDLGPATVRATRITYVGELGWELCVPVELAVGVYQDLLHAGEDLGVLPAGYYAIESLRLEKGYRAFGKELTPDYSPVEAGLLFACKLGTDLPFLGREAVERARAGGAARRLVSFVVDDPAPMLWGGELLLRDGVPVGQVTSAAWGETLGACVGLGYVRTPVEGDHEVDVGGDRYPVTVSLRPPYDPGNERVRG